MDEMFFMFLSMILVDIMILVATFCALKKRTKNYFIF